MSGGRVRKLAVVVQFETMSHSLSGGTERYTRVLIDTNLYVSDPGFLECDSVTVGQCFLTFGKHLVP
jgi:hypothetical protein